MRRMPDFPYFDLTSSFGSWEGGKGEGGAEGGGEVGKEKGGGNGGKAAAAKKSWRRGRGGG